MLRPKAALAAIPKPLRVIEGLMVSIPGEPLLSARVSSGRNMRELEAISNRRREFIALIDAAPRAVRLNPMWTPLQPPK
jgi:hypothetical protein